MSKFSREVGANRRIFNLARSGLSNPDLSPSGGNGN